VQVKRFPSGQGGFPGVGSTPEQFTAPLLVLVAVGAAVLPTAEDPATTTGVGEFDATVLPSVELLGTERFCWICTGKQKGGKSTSE